MTDSDIVALQDRVARLEAFSLAARTVENSPRVVGTDTIAYWAREDAKGVGAGYETNVLFIAAEGHEPNSYLCPITQVLHATDHPAATQASSQSTGTNVLAYKSGQNSAWLAADHIETHHGEDFWGVIHPRAGGVSLGRNAEIHRRSPLGLVGGHNIQATADSTYDLDFGIQLQATKPPGQGGSMKTGINFQGRFGIGIDLGPNDLKLAQGARIWYSQTGFLHADANGKLQDINGGKPRKITARVLAALRRESHPAQAPESLSPPSAEARAPRTRPTQLILVPERRTKPAPTPSKGQ